MNKNRLYSAGLALFALSGQLYAQDAVDIPLSAVEKYLSVLKEQQAAPSLFGKLGARSSGYEYVAYSTEAVKEEAWVDIFNSRPAWDNKERRCAKRLIGKDTCPENREELFRKSRPVILDSITGTIFSLGLKPIIGKMPWEVEFDHQEFRRAASDAESRLDHDAFKSLVERYRVAWEEVLAFEGDVRNAIENKHSDVDLALDGFGEGDDVSDDYFYDVFPEFSWRMDPPVANSLERLVEKMEFLAQQVRDRSLGELVSLNIGCPGKRLEHLIYTAQCNVSADWYGDNIVASGTMEVEQWKLPRIPVLEYSIGNEVLEAEFRNGLLAIVNVSDTAVNIWRIDFMNAGDTWKQPLAHNTVDPGKHIYYAELINDGRFLVALEEGKAVKDSDLLDEEQYGVRVRYSRSGGAATYLTEKTTIKEMPLANIQSLQKEGGLLEDLALFQKGFIDLKNARLKRNISSAIELIKQRQSQVENEG